MTDPSTTHRVDRSMSLLVDMTEAALDPAYADVARRTQAALPEGGGRRGTPVRAAALLLVIGTATGIGAAQVRAQAHAATSVRTGLVSEVQRATRETDQLASTVDRLRAQVATARDQRLGSDANGRAVASRLSALELVTGQTPVSGPGLVVTLDDAPDADAGSGTGRGGQLGDGRIYDRDLQDVANALWAAGAEAVSVNGQRLTALTAIRSAGESVLVDFRPLSPPYRLSAVGDVDAMEPRFADSATARRFMTYTTLYGLGFGVRRAGTLSLPAAAPPVLHAVRTPGGTG